MMLGELTHDLKTLWRVAHSDLRRSASNLVPSKPTTINLLVNDICNSRCVMCHIWKQKRGIELTPTQLSGVLADPLYEQVRYVGISGGEPTLRRDLPQLVEAVCQTLPNLEAVGIITNAIRENDVVERVKHADTMCRKHRKSFNVMVSLDGIGSVHDQVRGRPGNYESAVRVIDRLKNEHDLPLSVGCTVTKVNLWHVDDLLDHCIDRDIYARFRVAEFIQRLYNLGQTAYIRSFDDDEAYHLAMFFTRLEREYETRDAVRRTYRNIADMLLGRPRKTACPYQDSAVVLDCRGQLQYCAPRSGTLGNTLRESSLRLYRDRLSERKRIRKNDCRQCIHDYHAPITLSEYVSVLTDKYARRAMSIRNAIRLSNRLPISRAHAETHRPRRILITGWYGTETVGDKAILGGIIDHYRQQHPDVQFSVSSLYPFVTERTLTELGVAARVIPVYSPAFFRACRSHDEVVMGGGPLMDIAELGVVLTAFTLAASAGRRRVVFGCGLGPLNDVFCTEAVRRILNLADHAEFRDAASARLAYKMTGRQDFRCTADPAQSYVRQRAETLPTPQRQPLLACFLRQWPAGYRGDLSVAEYEHLRDRFEASLGRQIRDTCNRFGLRPALYSMHTFFEGGDDRRFNRAFASQHLADLDPIVVKQPSSVDQIVQAMRGAAACVVMRFHSVLFAHTLGLNFAAIDYTLGGKIHGYLSDHQALDRLITLPDIARADHEQLITAMLSERFTPVQTIMGVAA
ncbi:MAG: hypothetical protein Kow00105_04960 [Phycisphaeraceae bacterium]